MQFYNLECVLKIASFVLFFFCVCVFLMFCLLPCLAIYNLNVGFKAQTTDYKRMRLEHEIREKELKTKLKEEVEHVDSLEIENAALKTRYEALVARFEALEEKRLAGFSEAETSLSNATDSASGHVAFTVENEGLTKQCGSHARQLNSEAILAKLPVAVYASDSATKSVSDIRTLQDRSKKVDADHAEATMLDLKVQLSACRMKGEAPPYSPRLCGSENR